MEICVSSDLKKKGGAMWSPFPRRNLCKDRMSDYFALEKIKPASNFILISALKMAVCLHPKWTLTILSFRCSIQWCSGSKLVQMRCGRRKFKHSRGVGFMFVHFAAARILQCLKQPIITAGSSIKNSQCFSFTNVLCSCLSVWWFLLTVGWNLSKLEQWPCGC